MANGILLPCLPNEMCPMASDERASGLYCLSIPDIRNDWHDYGKDANTTDYLVGVPGSSGDTIRNYILNL